MSMKKLYAMPGHLVRRAQQISAATFMEECAAFNITPVQFASLFALREHPRIDATKLSALIAFDRSTLGNVIERLEAKGWIVRSPDLIDKRVKVIELTPAGRLLLKKVEPAVDRCQKRFLARLKPQDRKRFMEILSELVRLNNDMSRIPLKISSEDENSEGRRI
jgi:DNA-binding MarR family transcriptional regulator